MIFCAGCTANHEKPLTTNLQYDEYHTNVVQQQAPRKSIDVMNCPLTPTVTEDIKVPAIYKTNDLRRRTGYATYATGQFIRIKGIITDNNCVPVSNATVQIWQADSKGLYKNILQDSYLNDERMYSQQIDRFRKTYTFQKGADANFTGSGSTVTDNLGRFTFFSVIPGGEPIIMFRVLHNDFSVLNTAMYFPDNNNVSDLLKAEKIDEINNEIIYSYRITLAGQNKYLEY